MYIVHVHLSDRPGVNYWLRAKDGTLTTHVMLAFEPQYPTDVHLSLIALAKHRTAEGIDGVISATMQHFTTELLPPTIRQLVRLD